MTSRVREEVWSPGGRDPVCGLNRGVWRKSVGRVKMIGGEVGVVGDHHDGDFVKSDAEQGYEYGHSHGVVWGGSRHCVCDRTMVTAFSHVHGRVMPRSVDRH